MNEITSDIHFTCSGCGGHIAIEPAGAGIEITCPHCACSARVPTHLQTSPPPPPRLHEPAGPKTQTPTSMEARHIQQTEESQIASFRAAYSRRWRVQVVIRLVVLCIAIPMFLFEEQTTKSTPLVIGFLGAVVLAFLVHFRTSRCPACNGYLGWNTWYAGLFLPAKAEACPKCKLLLASPKPAVPPAARGVAPVQPGSTAHS